MDNSKHLFTKYINNCLQAHVFLKWHLSRLTKLLHSSCSLNMCSGKKPNGLLLHPIIRVSAVFLLTLRLLQTHMSCQHLSLQSCLICYILTLPLLFLFPLRPCIHLLMRLPILRIASLSSLSSQIPSLLTPLISSPILPLSQLISVPYYILGLIPLTASLSSAPIIQMETLQSFGLQPGPIRLTSIVTLQAGH